MPRKISATLPAVAVVTAVLLSIVGCQPSTTPAPKAAAIGDTAGSSK